MYAELTLDQGTTFSATIDLTNDDSSPLDLTSANLACQIRKSYYSTNATANIVVTIDGDAANGRVRLDLDAANTANIKAGRYLYDLKLTNSQDVTIRVLEGIITITPQVSR